MIDVIFVDDTLLVINKPPGLVVDSSQTNSTSTLENILISEFKINLPRGGIVHRLDKDTSGLLLVAKTQSALDNLQLQFQTRSIEKEYLTLVHGFISQSSGKIEGNIGRNPDHREKFSVLTTGGKEAQTEYQVLKKLKFKNGEFETTFEELNKIQLKKLERMNYNQFTLLVCHPLTGRTHQIRVHLKYQGFSIVADDKYGGRKVVRLDHRWCPRQFLHARKLEFDHPESGKRIKLEAELPDDLNQALAKLTEI